MTDESGFNSQGKIGILKTKAMPAKTNEAVKIPKETRTSKGVDRESFRGSRRLYRNATLLAIAMNRDMTPKGIMFGWSPCKAS
jgi:hypothetical protein